MYVFHISNVTFKCLETVVGYDILTFRHARESSICICTDQTPKQLVFEFMVYLCDND